MLLSRAVGEPVRVQWMRQANMSGSRKVLNGCSVCELG